MEAFVIKRSDGRYMFTYYVYDDENYGFGELNNAKLFDNIYDANENVRQIKIFYNINCQVVKVEIKELFLGQSNDN
jgi:hypothetical protein